MTESEWPAEGFEEHRGRLWAIAYRILGSATDADDAVQEAWLRFSRADTSGVDNLAGWLTTVVSRVCLAMLRARGSRPQPAGDRELPEPIAGPAKSDPEYEALVADSIGLALVVVLAALTRGREPVARFSRRARGARPALLDGAAAAVWMTDGELRVVYAITTQGDRITAIDLIADPERLRELDRVIG